jgi:hypothetical protein
MTTVNEQNLIHKTAGEQKYEEKYLLALNLPQVMTHIKSFKWI